MESSKIIANPMETLCNLDKDENQKVVEEIKYQGMICSILYLIASRPDIMFTMCLCARFQASPNKQHIIAIKRIL